MNSNNLTTVGYDRQVALVKKVSGLRIRDRREIFSYIRDASTTEATFMPYYGLTVGEFAVAQIIATENKRQ